MNVYKSSAIRVGAFLLHSTSSKVLFYHDVHLPDQQHTPMSTAFEIFAAHIDMMRQEKYLIVEAISKKKHQVQICFDDGFRGIYDNRKYFIEREIYPTVFLAVSLIGTYGYLDRDEIVELQRLGFRFQSHAWSHVNLTLFDDRGLEYELTASKAYLEELLQCPVTEICFPLGYFSSRVYNACKKAGYYLMYSSIPGSYYSTEREGLISRQLLQSYSAREVKAVLSGGLQLFRHRYRRAHFVVDDPSR